MMDRAEMKLDLLTGAGSNLTWSYNAALNCGYFNLSFICKMLLQEQ